MTNFSPPHHIVCMGRKPGLDEQKVLAIVQVLLAHPDGGARGDRPHVCSLQPRGRDSMVSHNVPLSRLAPRTVVRAKWLFFSKLRPSVEFLRKTAPLKFPGMQPTGCMTVVVVF